MSDTSCGWNDGCERTAEDGNTLCEDHIAEARRLRKIKVQGWRDAEAERLKKYAFIGAAIDEAFKAGVFGAMQAAETTGDHSVVVGHSRTNSQFYNYVMGTTKLSQVPVSGWESPAYVKGTINRIADGLSLEAAQAFANEYNSVLSEREIENTTAIVS